MDSESGDDPAFIDCVASGSESASGKSTARARQSSMPEMFQKAAGRRSKRQAAVRGPGSPPDPPPPAAKRADLAPAPEEIQLNAATLGEIKRLIDQGNARIIKTLENRLDSMEKRVALLEGECMDKDTTIERLTCQLHQQTMANEELDARLEELDNNGRLSSLILTCETFVSHPRNEDIEQLVVSVLNQRIDGLNLSKSDLHVAHKLQNDAKVICKFVKRQVRDSVYDARFDMARFPDRSGRRAPPLYISESLTPRNRQLFEELLRARRPENGGLVASVFSRRGMVWCRKEKGGSNLRVQDSESLQRILGGRRFPPQSRSRSLPAPAAAAGARRRPSPSAGAGTVVAPAAGRAPLEPAGGGGRDVRSGGAPAPAAVSSSLDSRATVRSASGDPESTAAAGPASEACPRDSIV